MKLNIMNEIKNIGPRIAGRLQVEYDSFFRGSSSRAVLRRLKYRQLLFFLRKIPTGENYPYDVHYPATLKNCPHRLKSFYLVGRAWKASPEAPVALAFGFNDWKLGFVADYCPDQRIAFSKRKVNYASLWFRMHFLGFTPACLYVWGYTNPKFLVRYARRNKIPLIRVEDAFIRSADLGANHATPYSLVFDKKGLYYNTDEPNDLERILADHNFDDDRVLMEQSRAAQTLMLKNNLSKYNLPDRLGRADQYRIKTRHRVLVVGQVEKDAAVRMGNPNNWKQIDIVRLAKLENPDSEIFYRPHPDVHRGFQKSRFKGRQLKGFAEVLSPEGSIAELLETVDQVYTISSLTGMEALIRGVKVTTLGTPFYAGWGLTDDRAARLKSRKLSIDEIFAGCYLLYPRYLADLDNSWTGFQTATLAILGGKKYLEIDHSTIVGDQGRQSHSIAPEHSIFSNDYDQEQPIDSIFVANHFSNILNAYQGRLAQIAVSLTICGRVKSNLELSKSLRIMIDHLDLDSAGYVLRTIYKMQPGGEVASVVAGLIQQIDPAESGTEIFRELKTSSTIDSGGSDLDVDVDNDEDETSTIDDDEGILELAAVQFGDNLYEESLSNFFCSLIGKSKTLESYQSIAEIAYRTFDFQSAYSLAWVYIKGTGKTAPWAIRIINLTETQAASSDAIISNGAFFSEIRPPYAPVYEVKLGELEIFEQVGLDSGVFHNLINVMYRKTVHYGHALLEAGEIERAHELAVDIAARDNSYQAAVLLSKTLSALDDYETAFVILDETLASYPKQLVFDEILKLCIYISDYSKALKIGKLAQAYGVDLGEVLPRKILFGQGKIQEAYETYRTYKVATIFARYYSDRYAWTPNTSENKEKTIFLAPIFGPGDEIRFASIYNKISDALNFSTTIVGCEPRLYDLFKRSFEPQGVDIKPIARVLRQPKVDLKLYDQLPGADLMPVLDNNGHFLVQQSDQVALVTDLLGSFLTDYKDFSGSPYLIADKKRVTEMSSFLPRNELLVGINWRSSVTHHSRREHYLTVEDILPLFKETSIQFVNLQYDECAEELAFLEERYTGRMINIDGLDQFNDFDGVAALMKNLDLVIAPCTTVAELAGGLGCRTLLLSNSSELHWRKLENSQVDVWHNSVEHVEGETIRDKGSLVTALVSRLKQFVEIHGK